MNMMVGNKGPKNGPDESLKSKFLGALVGSALGDAIGELAFQFPVKDRLITVVDQSLQLRYTDDTAMAIGLAESLVENGDILENHLGNTFSNHFAREPWRGYASGPPNIFSLVKMKGMTYCEAAKSLFHGQGSLGNGAAMRIVPVGLFFCDSSELYEKACASAAVTHTHPIGIDGAAIQAQAVAHAVKLNPQNALPTGQLFQVLIKCARTPQIKEKLETVQHLIAEDASPDRAANRLGRSVAVHESMPFSLYSFFRYPHDFEECLFCAILNGGDRDTLGAMACALSGAYLGIHAISQAWQNRLENRSYIEELSMRLFRRRQQDPL
jgi:poly(ADP-ribose) glycohydrolase ARH3